MTTTPLPEVTSPEPKSFVVASALSLLFFLLLSHSTSSIVRVAAVRTISTDREEDTPATMLSEKTECNRFDTCICKGLTNCCWDRGWYEMLRDISGHW
ncbi:hypothetical protein GBAR_LOCUS19481 [Geodia barretti]|uniref:Uncharacterized protein n=1 Tax=Geodia barretti TaxID=519541 RepID=A0AA35WUU0_GEOBA|nr:hypothetical protein GBAR_LOCUS19481 [Geodia barretti]